MAPKKEKKKKKSKAELEAERIEKERIEELEAKERTKKLEEARIEREALEKRKKETQMECRMEELEALSVEYGQEESKLDARRGALREAREAAEAICAWDTYRECSQLPAAESDRELNAHLSELYDALRATETGADGTSRSYLLKTALRTIARGDQICASLEGLRADAAARRDAPAAARASRFLRRLRDASCAQLDRATAHVLQHADELSSQPQTAGVRTPAARDEEEKKEHFEAESTFSAFGELGDAPGATDTHHTHAMSSLSVLTTVKSVRTMTSHAHMSDHEVMKAGARRGGGETKSTEEFEPLELGPEAADVVETRVGVWANLSTKSLRGPFKQLVFGPKVELQVDLPKALGTQRLGARVFFWPYEHVARLYRGGPSEGEDDTAPYVAEQSAHAEVPQTLLRGDEMLVVGGSILLEILELPPAPREIKPKWTMQQVTALATSVKVQHFPPGAEHGQHVPLSSLGGLLPNQYLRARVTVPDGVVLPSPEHAASLRVAWWDTARRFWVDGITSQVEYNAAKREVGFNAARSGMLALVQPRTLDLPYVAWSLTPTLPEDERASESEEACCRLALQTQRFEVVIEVRGSTGLCRLLEPKSVPELLPLIGGGPDLLPPRSLPPGRMLAALTRAGIHLQPADGDAAAARLKGRELLAVKTASLERKLCEEIAGLAAGYDFAECACGRDLGAGRCALRARETSRYVGDDTEHLDYATLLVELDECSKTQRDAPGVGKAVGSSIKCSLVLGGAASFAEDGQTDAEDDSNESAPPVFDESQVAGQASHLYLHRCLHPVSSTEAADRVAKAPPLFHSSVEELLHLTRPFSFF